MTVRTITDVPFPHRAARCRLLALAAAACLAGQPMPGFAASAPSPLGAPTTRAAPAAPAARPAPTAPAETDPASRSVAARSRMLECGHQWSSMKKAGTATGTWKDFSRGCLAQR